MKSLINKIRYYFERLNDMDHQGFKDAITYAHKKSGKPKFVIFFDMVYCSFKYVSGYVDYNEFEFYALNREQRKTFITLGHIMKVVKRYNDKEYLPLFDDKSKFNKHFNKYIRRDYIDIRETDAEGMKSFMESKRRVMAKRATDFAGRGITKYDLDRDPIADYQVLYDALMDNKQYLIEDFLQQHEMMNELSSKAVNTMRMITFVDNDQVPHLIVAALKSGLGGDMDNIGQGGMYTILNDEGVVTMPFIDKYNNHHETHPLTGKNLIGFTVPNFEKIVEQVMEACLVVPQVRFIGWDVAVSVDGDAILIEGNSSSGPFQVIPSLTDNPVGIRPKLEQYLDFKF